METETLSKIRIWEKERDRCLSIHCNRVAAKYQRWIDKAMESIGMAQTKPRDGDLPNDVDKVTLDRLKVRDRLEISEIEIGKMK